MLEITQYRKKILLLKIEVKNSRNQYQVSIAITNIIVKCYHLKQLLTKYDIYLVGITLPLINW